jgi:ankyrin repeat protein
MVVDIPLPSSDWEYTENNPGKFLVKDAFFGFLDSVKTTLKKNPEYVDYHSQYYDGMTALIAASRGGHRAIVKHLLLYDGKMDINAIDSYGKTALMWAAEEGHVEIIKLLIIEPTCKINHKTAINMTQFHGTNVKNVKGKTARMFSKEKGNQEIVSLLQE